MAFSASAAASRQMAVSAHRLEASAAEHGYELFVPPLSLCTDNAVMGAIAIERLRAGKVEDLSLDINPGPERGWAAGPPANKKRGPKHVLQAAFDCASPKLSKTTGSVRRFASCVGDQPCGGRPSS